jgi:hypothetical protein
VIALRIGALLALGAMLLAFQYVVAQGEHAGALRRAAMTAESDARWQCEALRQAADRTACRARLQPVPRDNAQLSSR